MNREEYFEEQLRLAEEMSFIDEYELTWDPTDLSDTKDRVKRYEDIVNEQLFILDKFIIEEDETQPIPDSQIKDLFFQSLDSNDPSSTGGGGARNSHKLSLSDDSHHNHHHIHHRGSGGEIQLDYSPTFSERRSGSGLNAANNSTSNKEMKLKETVDSIRRSLRWYQNKIVKQIESTSEVSYSLSQP